MPFPLPCQPPTAPCPFHTFVLLLQLAAVAGGGTKARRATATGGTNTRRARGARRAKRPARRSAQTKRTRRPWSSNRHPLPPPPVCVVLSLSVSGSCLSLRVCHTHDDEEGKGGLGTDQEPESQSAIDTSLHQATFSSVLAIAPGGELMERRRWSSCLVSRSYFHGPT